MAKVYGLHLVAVKAGASGEEFERFFREDFLAGPELPGVAFRLLKADRGLLAGQYLVMIEFDSNTRRNQMFPLPGPNSPQVADEFMQWILAKGAALARWDQYATPFDVIYSDYVDVSA